MLLSINVLVMHVELSRADDMSKVLNLIGEPRALFQVQGNPGFAEAVQDRVDVLDMLLRVSGEDNDIVQVDEACLPLQTG